MALDLVVGIVAGDVLHLAVPKPVPINSVWSKTYILTPRSTFYDARELIYPLKWPWTMLHPKVALDHVVGIVFGIGVHLAVLKPVPINSAWSKTYI